MTSSVKIGVVCLARTTFDHEAAAGIYAQKQAELRGMSGVEWLFIEGLVIEAEDAEKAADRFAAAGVDGLVVISGTFHLGHLALILHTRVAKPMLLWAFSELPYNGGKIRLNSVCGLNLNASNLYKAGCDSYCCTTGDSIDTAWVDALRVQAGLARAHVGVAGYRAHGFFNLDVEDLAIYRQMGMLIDHYELEELYAGAAGVPGALADELRAAFDCSGITAAQLDKTARLAESMEGFLKANRLDALAIRCWPEFAAQYGVAPCAAMSALAARGHILGCEGDVEGTISLLAGSLLSKDVPFMADLSQINFEEDYALMWHCGVASPTLWDGKCELTLDTYFAGGKGVTSDLVMKSGEVTVFRIDTARGETRLFLEKGRAVPMEKLLRGSYAKVVFEKPVSEILQTVTTTGVAHHVAMVYGNCAGALRRLARIKGWRVLE